MGSTRDEAHAVIDDPDIVLTMIFSATGLALAIFVAAYFPLKRNARMKKQPKARQLQALPKTRSHYVHAANEPWQRLYAAVTDPDLHAVVAFCLIGLLLLLNLIFRFPDLGAVIAQCNQF